MVRNFLSIALGILLSFLLLPAGGYFVYHLEQSTGWPEPRLGSLVRFVMNPLIAIVVGSVVGAVAKSRAAVLAALSLLPWALGPLFYKRLSVGQEAIVFFSSALSVLLGVIAATLVCRVPMRSRPMD